MSDRHIRRSGSDYTEAFLALLPQGQAWPKHAPDSILVQGVTGLCDFWGFVDGRAADLLERESDPRLTIELLPDWERNWGLPDPCYTAPLTIDERQLGAGHADDDAGRAVARVLHRRCRADRLSHHDLGISGVGGRTRSVWR